MRWMAAWMVAACAVAADSGRLLAQVPSGHENHAAQLRALPQPAPARVMSPQPNLDRITLVDQGGRTVRLHDAVGSDKPVVVNFIFTTCTTICPVMSAGVAQLLSNLGTDADTLRVISISIDPDTDTVDALKAYAARYHAPASWRLLTGTAAAVEAAQRAFGSYRGGKNNHAPATYIRSSAAAPWIALDGFASADTLRHASLGHLLPTQR